MQQQTFDLGDLVGFSGIWNARFAGERDHDWKLVRGSDSLKAATTFAVCYACSGNNYIGTAMVEVQGTEPDSPILLYRIDYSIMVAVQLYEQRQQPALTGVNRQKSAE